MQNCSEDTVLQRGGQITDRNQSLQQHSDHLLSRFCVLRGCLPFIVCFDYRKAYLYGPIYNKTAFSLIFCLFVLN